MDITFKDAEKGGEIGGIEVNVLCSVFGRHYENPSPKTSTLVAH